MEEMQEKIKKKRAVSDWDLKKYIVIAAVTFVTFCCCILFFFFIYRYHGFTAYWQKIMGILQPVIMGFIVAYLLNPVMSFLEKHLIRYLKPKMKDERKAKKTARSLGTLGAIAFFILIIFLLLYMMIPELIRSIQNMMVSLPAELASFDNWMKSVMAEDSQMREWLGILGIDISSAGGYVEKLFRTQIFPQINTYLTYVASFTTGVISAFKMLFNFAIGLVIAIYLLTSVYAAAAEIRQYHGACYAGQQSDVWRIYQWKDIRFCNYRRDLLHWAYDFKGSL